METNLILDEILNSFDKIKEEDKTYAALALIVCIADKAGGTTFESEGILSRAIRELARMQEINEETVKITFDGINN